MRLFFILFLSFTLVACSQKVHIKHSQLDPDGLSDGKLPIKVLVQSLPDELQKPISEVGVLIVGPLNDWKIDLNSSLPQAAHDVLEHHYSAVKLVKNFENNCADCGMIVRPLVIDMSLNKITMQATVDVEFKIFDADAKLITTLNASGRSSILSPGRVGTGVVGYFVPFFGSVVGPHVVAGSVKKALDNALYDVSDQLVNETQEGGILARMFLPKNLKRKKIYGDHEFVAENLARSEGCNLTSDGIQLKEKVYSQELYEAYCWGKPVFSIACEYGSCEVKRKDGPLVTRMGAEELSVTN